MRHLLIATLLCLFLSACGPSVDETAIRSNILAMRTAIQAHDPGAFMRHVDDSYSGMINHNRDRLEVFVNTHLDNNRVIYIYLAEITIELDDDRAKANFFSGVAGGPDQLPARGQLYRVRTEWLKLDGEWKLAQARWRPAIVLDQLPVQ